MSPEETEIRRSFKLELERYNSIRTEFFYKEDMGTLVP